jgi:hypothetical protein
MFIKSKTAEAIKRFFRVLKKSLILVEAIRFNRTFVPETSRNKGVNFNAI